MAFYRFGSFTLDERAGTLHRKGRRMRLARQPFRLLLVLVSRAGELVTRHELHREIWGDETFVDFELGLNYAVSRLRGVLGEDARSPRLIETVRGEGLRFVAPVECRRIPERPTLAVLPFQVLADDQQRRYLAEGLADLLTTELAKISSMDVISRQSVRHLRDSTDSATEIGRMLKADVLVEGTLLIAGDRLRVNVQAVEVDRERHAWAESFEGTIGDVLTMQGRVAHAVAQGLAVTLTPDEETRLVERRTATPEAQLAFLEARELLSRHTRHDMEAAVARLRQAIAADPEFAEAYAQLAICLSWAAFWGYGPIRESCQHAREAAQRAIQLDPASAAAHLAVGRCRLFNDWDLAGASDACRRALELDASNVSAWLLHAILVLWGPGDHAAAVAAIDRALSLDPVSGLTGSLAAWLLLFAGEVERALEQAAHTLELHPATVQALHVMGWAHAKAGRWPEAVAAFEKAAAMAPDPFTLVFLALMLPRVGRRTEAEGLLPPLLEGVREGRVPSRGAALAYAGLGDMDRAFEWLDRGLDERDPALMGIRVSPPLETFSRDARYEGFVERVRRAMTLATG